MNLFHQASMAEKVIAHTNTQHELAEAKREYEDASRAYFDAMSALPSLGSEVLNSPETQQRMVALRRAYDVAKKRQDTARTAEYKAFVALSK